MNPALPPPPFSPAGATTVPTALAVIPDLNSDGAQELVVGNSGDDTGGTDFGAVFIVHLTSRSCAGGASLCATGSALQISDGNNGFTHSCTGGACLFGSSLGYIGDVDGDSVPDLVVGSKSDDCGGTDRGAVWVLFLQGGGASVRKAVKICAGAAGLPAGFVTVDGSEFGTSVDGAGDIDADGIPGLCVRTRAYLCVSSDLMSKSQERRRQEGRERQIDGSRKKMDTADDI